MSIKIYADGADLGTMAKLAPRVQGFTTNPTLMRKAGVTDYAAFAKSAIAAFPNHPISLEVFSDDIEEMDAQARKISSWGTNVHVKIPVTTTRGISCCPLVSRLARSGIKVNVTAIMAYSQIDEVCAALDTAAAVISIFAGRIADTGRLPAPFVAEALRKRTSPQHEVLWASPRQVMDVYTADSIGCDIITCTPEIIAKLALEGQSLVEYSRETVQMFHDDAKAAGYSI